MLKKIILIFLCFAAVIAFSGCENAETGEYEELSPPEANGEFSVKVLSVGKADAVILKTENHTVLIDTGNRGDGKDILNELGGEAIDFLIITHFDKDHIGGAVKVINNAEIGEIISPKYKGAGDEYARYIKCLSENGKKQTILNVKRSFILDDVLFEIYPAKKNTYKESDNDYSIVISVTHGENKFLFAGDAEAERLAELPTQMNMAHNFLKVPHHGVLSDGSEEFLKSVDPEYAVITDSEDEPADVKVVEILESMGGEVYSTADGAVTVTSDGKSLDISR